jgi:hypothetical protein
MTVSEEQIEWIVTEVIRRLGLLDGVAVGERSSTAAELRLTDQVITLRTLEGRLANVARLVVLPRAVVTPTVKDELRARGIELVRG